MSRVRSWLVLSSPVSITRSARSRSPLEQEPLVGDGVHHPPGGLGVAAAGPLEPPDQDVVGGVEEEDAHPVPARLESVDGREHVVEVSPAAADHEGHPLELGPGAVHQLRHLRDERRGHVVDHEPARGPRAWPPAVDRPAPDMPVTTRYSLIDPPLPTVRQAPSEPWACGAARIPMRPPRPVTTIRPATPPWMRFVGRPVPPNCSIRRFAALGPQARRRRPGRPRSSVCPAGSRWYEMAKRWASSRRRWSR